MFFIKIITKNDWNSKQISNLFIISAIIFVIGCSILPESTKDESSNPSTSSNSPLISANDEDLNKIVVKIDPQDLLNQKKRYKTVVYIENTTANDFIGDVVVFSHDVDGSIIDSDTIYVGESENPLHSQQQTYAILWLKRGIIPKFTYKVSGKFIAYTGYKSKINFVVVHAQVGPAAANFWIVVPDNKDTTLVDVSKEILARYAGIKTITADFYVDKKAAEDKAYDLRRHPFATLEQYPGKDPTISFWDRKDTLPVK